MYSCNVFCLYVCTKCTIGRKGSRQDLGTTELLRVIEGCDHQRLKLVRPCMVFKNYSVIFQS
jgi:hypothetical protein